jgi:transcriptional regulator with XRE-family HTH domain
MLKEIRIRECLSQAELAEKANVTQSVIARIETGSSRTLPRLDLFKRILQSVGYETLIVAKKKGRIIRVALT